MLLQVIRRIKNVFYFLKNKIKAKIKHEKCFRVASLEPQGACQGNVLISYRIEPFFLKPNDPISNDHTWHWECRQIALTFLELGYCVDVIQFHNHRFVPRKNYAFFIDIRHRLESLAPLLNKDCIKILHSDTAHILYHDAAELNRLLSLQQRKGITLKAMRYEPVNNALEHADCGIVLGNEFTANTFSYAKKPIYRVPISAPQVYPWQEKKDFEAARKTFLWFGSGGLVHKGLDLVLDAFVDMPDHNLIICGPISNEKDFEAAFYTELYRTPNIKTVGWVDISSPKFLEVANSCLGIIYPSCSEGGGGCVITCMHAGLIPIVSYESSVEVHEDYGVILKESSVAEIKNSIRAVAALPASQLEVMARNAWEFANKNHTRENFASSYRKTIQTVIAVHSKKPVLNNVWESEKSLLNQK